MLQWLNDARSAFTRYQPELDAKTGRSNRDFASCGYNRCPPASRRDIRDKATCGAPTASTNSHAVDQDFELEFAIP